MVEQQNIQNDLFSDIAVKLRDMEEKQNILKDRVLLIGENLISEKNSTNQEISSIKNSILILSEEIKRAKLTLKMLMDNSDNFARKNELEILKRQFEMFQPLNLARISDVEYMIAEAHKKKNN